jgi:hypothetical protein
MRAGFIYGLNHYIPPGRTMLLYGRCGPHVAERSDEDQTFVMLLVPPLPVDAGA